MQEENKQQKEQESFEKELIASVVQDFENRRKERLLLERQWELNLNFLKGNQYCGINSKGELYEKNNGEYYWQERGVFNHIAPIMETRMSRLMKINPEVCVRPKTDDDSDVSGATIAEKAISGLFQNIGFKDIVRKTTLWSEACGTGFYKITWDNEAGKEIGILNGKKIKEGDVQITSVSPFEIFPDNLMKEDFNECFSIIHARALSVREIKEKYGVDVLGEAVNLLTLSSDKYSSNSANTPSVLNGACIVIEKYEKPSALFPEGRMITVAGDKLLYYGELPYLNGKDKKKDFPFVKQESIEGSSGFFGSSIIERLIPIQRAYNAVKNRKHEFLNRLSTGVMMVEDGSVDVDDLEQEGLPPGKILVYRQGAKEPQMMDGFTIPSELNDEETKLIAEFDIISGVSDVSSSSRSNKVQSGAALEILVEQDNERIIPSSERIRDCYLEVARHVLRLYAQFLAGVKIVKYKDNEDKTHVYYLDAKAVNSDETYIQGANELMESSSKRRETILSLYEKGLFNDEEGNVRPEIKEKLLNILGFQDLDYQKGLSRLQAEKAKNENAHIRKNGAPIEIIDDDNIHIQEHTRYVFSEYDELTEEQKQRLYEHISAHKNRHNKKTEI